MSCAAALLASSCRKEPNPIPDPATVAAIQEMRISYNSAKTYNDSLNYWYNMDSAHYIVMIHYCDSLYHNSNNIMMNKYNIMNSGGGMMNGGMMNGGNSNGGMMGGNNTSLNCNINGNNSTVMINSLHQQHIHHPRY